MAKLGFDHLIDDPLCQAGRLKGSFLQIMYGG